MRLHVVNRNCISLIIQWYMFRTRNLLYDNLNTPLLNTDPLVERNQLK